MKLADYIINQLGELGITDVFEVYGAANGPLIDAFTRTKKTRYVAVMNEQAGGFAAEGYAKASGNFGVMCATSGPGGGNCVTPIMNCFYDSVPCLFLTGQIHSNFQRPDPSIRQRGFQETDIVSIVKPITKYAVRINDAKTIRYELEKALFIMKDGRPGPVLIDIPVNLQRAEIDPEALEGFGGGAIGAIETIFSADKMDEQIDQLIEELGQAERPCILVGGGVRMAKAVEEFCMVANILNMPVFPTYNALDVASADQPWYGGLVGTFGGPGRNFGLQNSDFLLNIGSRLSGRIIGGNAKSFARTARRWTVDIDEPLLRTEFQEVPFHVNVHADAKVFLQHLLSRLVEKRTPNWDSWLEKVIGWRDKYDPVLPEYCDLSREVIHPYHFFRVLGDLMGPKDILVGDCGGNLVASNHSFRTKYGQLNLTNNGDSPMGFSYAGAMGAWLGARGERQAVCTIGDGGFMMNLQEIQTVLNYNLGFKTFIVDNRCYGITRQFQRTNFDGRMEACGPVGYNPPDFVKVCKGFGMPVCTIDKPADLRAGIQSVLDHNGPIVCVVNCKDEDNYQPRIAGWTAPIEDMSPYLPRDEFRANMLIDPVTGWETPEKY